MSERDAVGKRSIERPAGRRASRRHRERDFERHRGVMLEAAKLLRPAYSQQLCVADHVDDLGRYGAVALGLFGQSPDLGYHRLGAGDHFPRRGSSSKVNAALIIAYTL